MRGSRPETLASGCIVPLLLALLSLAIGLGVGVAVFAILERFFPRGGAGIVIVAMIFGALACFAVDRLYKRYSRSGIGLLFELLDLF